MGRPDALSGFLEVVHRLLEDGVFVGQTEVYERRAVARERGGRQAPAIPITEPKGDNPLMRHCFREIGLSGKQLAKRCGVNRPRIYMARTRNLSADNAEKISRGMARIRDLLEPERLELVFEIIGYPGDQVRAYLGSSRRTMKLLDVSEPTDLELINVEKSITHGSGMQALEKLREIGAPEFVIRSAEMRLMPLPNVHVAAKPTSCTALR